MGSLRQDKAVLFRSAALLWLLPSLAGIACGGRASQSRDGNASGGRDGSGGMTEDCASYADQAEHTVEVHITNSTGKALYFGPTRPGADPTPAFELRDAAGAYLSLPHVESCPDQCVRVMNGTGDCGHPTPIESARRLLSKATMQRPWTGTYVLTPTLPVVCQPNGATAPVVCQQEVAAPPGLYTFTARAGTSIHCGDGACPACAVDDDECFIPGAIIEASTKVEATVNLDGSYGLSSAGGGPPTSLPAVELTFEL